MGEIASKDAADFVAHVIDAGNALAGDEPPVA
jgi:hypothetical protein